MPNPFFFKLKFMNIEEFNKGIEFYKNLLRTKAQSIIMKNEAENYALLRKMYKFAFNKEITRTCANCYSDAIFELINFKNHYMKKLNLRYVLKAGKIFRINGKFYKKESLHLTNEICEEILKIYGEKAFEKIMKDTKDVVKEVKSEKPKVVSEKKNVELAEAVIELPEDFEFLKLKEMKVLEFVKKNFSEEEIGSWKTKKQAIEKIKSI